MSDHSDNPGKMAGRPARLPLSALMGSSRRVQEEKRDHFGDANKMACRHEPRDPVAAFVHVCKRCGVPIEARSCMACDGMGLSGTSDRRCPVCRGTGIDRWEVET